MTFRLIRTTGIVLTDAVNAAVASMGSDDSRSSTEMAMGAVDAYIAAAPEAPTDAELDELCRAMWPTTGIFEPGAAQFATDYPDSPVAKGWTTTRDGYRRVMRRFLSALQGEKHG